MIDEILKKITDAFSSLPFLEGIVLGGSRATGTASRSSDLDIGIYYRKKTVDFSRLNQVASDLDDEHREPLIGPEGDWGRWVNCGGWLKIDGLPVDLILRDLDRVEPIIYASDQGNFSPHYQTGHPHAYLDVMYRGELAASKVLYAPGDDFCRLKRQAEQYPEPLRESLISFFRFEAGFSCMLAKKSAPQGDLYYVAGHLFRSVSALNQVLFALNRTYCLNEKKAVRRIETFPKAPARYARKVEEILSLSPDSAAECSRRLEALCGEVDELAGE